MTDLQKAIQEFEDEAYHKRLHPEISDQSKTVALATMIEKQKLMSNGLTSQLLVEISRAAGDLHTSLFCRTCGDGLDLELVDGAVVEEGPAKEFFEQPKEERVKAFLRSIEHKEAGV